MHEATLAAILEVADEGFVVFDRDRRCTLANRRVGELFGVDRGALVGRAEAEVLPLLAASCEEPETFAARIAQAHRQDQTFELDLKRPTLRIVQLRTHLVAAGGALSSDGGWMLVVRDVTRERSAERRSHQLLQRLEQITSTDALTQLPNRRRFQEELDREHGRASRAWDSYAVFRVDVDGLSVINAELGVPRGDEVLEYVADRLRQGRREYDLLARWGDDEFVLLAPGADAHGARAMAQRMAAAVAEEPLDIGEHRTITVTIGVAVWVPPSGESGNDVLERAAAALKTAQSRGERELEIS